MTHVPKSFTSFRSWVSARAPNGCSLSSLFYFFALFTCACRFEVTVTSGSLPPCVSHRGLFKTKHCLSQRPMLTPLVPASMTLGSRAPACRHILLRLCICLMGFDYISVLSSPVPSGVALTLRSRRIHVFGCAARSRVGWCLLCLFNMQGSPSCSRPSSTEPL